LQSSQDARDLAELDNKIGDLIDQVRESKVRRDFMLSFANDPAGFIQKWIVSQHKDLKVRLCKYCWGG
jgi:SWI/SNF-related matrix-associated actin-dependent regulator of chromatin subfamily D